jgi:hypothetical protein
MNGALDALLVPDVRPFAVAGAIMIALGVIELLTTLIGTSISQMFGKEIDLNADHNAVEGLMLWINAGRIPLLILILLALGIFSIEGFALQGIAHGIGVQVPAWIASLAAVAGTVPAVRVTSRGISRIIPRDESYAVDEAEFVGHVATVSIGPLDQGLPGRVRLKDAFGNWHSAPARASSDSSALAVGTSVLLVDRDAKGFIAIAAPADLIEQQSKSNGA